MQQTFKTVFSKSWALIKPDLVAVGKGFVIAIIGGLITYLQADFMSDLKIAMIDNLKPEYMAIAIGVMTAINSSIVNFLRKLIGQTVYIDKQ